ncbi:hypothetical protein ACNR9Q_08085 [Maribacter sp. X9]|uniref:hypothetical protein n=1 Tax=Maribacter sp. X9 TaxID=3402159 RepID=UPI003AF3E025
MKNVFLVLTLGLLINIVWSQDKTEKINFIIEGTYDAKTDRGYRFINRLDNTPILFDQVRPRLHIKSNLEDDSLIGSMFKITYGTEEFKQNGPEGLNNGLPYKEKLIILNMKLIE